MENMNQLEKGAIIHPVMATNPRHLISQRNPDHMEVIIHLIMAKAKQHLHLAPKIVNQLLMEVAILTLPTTSHLTLQNPRKEITIQLERVLNTHVTQSIIQKAMHILQRVQQLVVLKTPQKHIQAGTTLLATITQHQSTQVNHMLVDPTNRQRSPLILEKSIQNLPATMKRQPPRSQVTHRTMDTNRIQTQLNQQIPTTNLGQLHRSLLVDGTWRAIGPGVGRQLLDHSLPPASPSASLGMLVVSMLLLLKRPTVRLRLDSA